MQRCFDYLKTSLLMVSLIGGLAFAKTGTSDGGGGKGVKCGRSIKTLDLFEAQQKAWPNPISDKNFEDDLYIHGLEYLIHMTESIESYNGPVDRNVVLNVFQDFVLNKIQDIPQGTRLPLTNDATIPNLPNNCEIVQLAVYSYAEARIYRDREYWDQLSTADQVALVLHEAFYYRSRSTGGVLNSDEVRNVVGRLMSRQTLNPLFSEIWFSNSHLVCVAGSSAEKNNYEFYVEDTLQSGHKGVGFYFGALQNRYAISLTQGFIPGLSVKNISNMNFTPQSFQVKNAVTGEMWDLELSVTKSQSSEGLILSIKNKISDQTAPGFCQKEIK